jgi:hypothetical protein
MRKTRTEPRTPNAADIVDARYGWRPEAAASGFWKALGEEAKNQGLYWGGDWPSFRDFAHVQLLPNSQLNRSGTRAGYDPGGSYRHTSHQRFAARTAPSGYGSWSAPVIPRPWVSHSRPKPFRGSIPAAPLFRPATAESRNNAFAWVLEATPTANEAQIRLSRLRARVKDAYVKHVTSNLGRCSAFAEAQLIALSQMYRKLSTSWADGDRVSSAYPLADGRTLLVLRYFHEG